MGEVMVTVRLLLWSERGDFPLRTQSSVEAGILNKLGAQAPRPPATLGCFVGTYGGLSSLPTVVNAEQSVRIPEFFFLSLASLPLLQALKVNCLFLCRLSSVLKLLHLEPMSLPVQPLDRPSYLGYL
jgi:hypothetical protein